MLRTKNQVREHSRLYSQLLLWGLQLVSKFYIPISILVKDFEFGLQFLLCGVWYTPDDVNKLAWGERKEDSIYYSSSSIFVAHSKTFLYYCCQI